jgi:hypothetical protein
LNAISVVSGNPETTEMAFKNGKSRDNRNGIKE